MNLMMLLEMAATAMGDRVAVGPRGSGITCDDLIGRAAGLAGRLRASRSERLLLCGEPGAILPVSLFGAAWGGAAYVPVNYRLGDDDLRALAERASPALAVADSDGAARLAGVDGLEIVERDGLLADPSGGAETADPGDWPADPDATAVLLYTSGTSGPPKAAVLRHRHLVSYVFSTVEFASAGPDEAHIMAVPPYHVASVAAQLSQVYSGRRIVPLAKFDPEAWIDLVRDEDVTHAMLVPTMLARIVDALDRRGETLETVRFVSYGGGKSHRTVVERALEVFPAAGFSHAYGLTETSSTVCVMGPDDHRRWAASDDPDERARLSSAGRPLPGVEVSVRSPDGTTAGTGTAGEIWVRGEQVAGEYADGGSQLNEDGWFCTRDSGHLDEAGYLWVHGRNDDIIIRGGENMSPGEIEDALLTHPAVVDAAAFGVPSREWGEEVAVCVVARSPIPTADDLRELVRARLRSSRVPARIEFVDDLPYNDTGKLLRRELRSRHAADPGSQVD
ncbi:MAG: acyl--CoA ligase [Acidimicrobiaceae bacterium]|nr:acyl--CoA ligase [Acidimicrobiaceae bacterium]MYE66535.1 acyl--CoA ligase [Acidimicrobiaceae bacterium]